MKFRSVHLFYSLRFQHFVSDTWWSIRRDESCCFCVFWVFSSQALSGSFPFRLLQLQEQMRALYKAISVPRARRASSKGGGCYSSQSGSGWDEYTKRVTSECLNWMRQQKVNLCKTQRQCEDLVLFMNVTSRAVVFWVPVENEKYT